MFEKATKMKLRFPSPVGHLNVEDLWDLPLTSTTGSPNLDDTAKTVNRLLKANEEESFVATKTTGVTADTLRLDILKHIIADRLAENERKLQAAENKMKKQKILEIIAKKEDAGLESKSVAALTKMVDDL